MGSSEGFAGLEQLQLPAMKRAGVAKEKYTRMNSTFHTAGAKYPQTHPSTAARSARDSQDGRGQNQAQSPEVQSFAVPGGCSRAGGIRNQSAWVVTSPGTGI